MLYPVDDVVDESDDNEETEGDTENDTENEEDEKDHRSAVTLSTHRDSTECRPELFTPQIPFLHFHIVIKLHKGCDV